LFSGLLKCGECGANLIVGTGGGTHKHKKYVCANYFNRGTCGNDLYIRRDVLEERLLKRLQSELLRPEVIDYAVGEVGRQLRSHRLSLSGDLSKLRLRKEQLDRETTSTTISRLRCRKTLTRMSYTAVVASRSWTKHEMSSC
jgi:hypothetical protein